MPTNNPPAHALITPSLVLAGDSGPHILYFEPYSHVGSCAPESDGSQSFKLPFAMEHQRRSVKLCLLWGIFSVTEKCALLDLWGFAKTCQQDGIHWSPICLAFKLALIPREKQQTHTENMLGFFFLRGKTQDLTNQQGVFFYPKESFQLGA